MKVRVLYILHRYPQLSETYIKAEIEAVRHDYDLRIVTFQTADQPYRNHLPYEHIIVGNRRLRAIIDEFQPHVLHSHYVTNMPHMAKFAEWYRIPYTVRAHSFDTIGLQGQLRLDDYCLGVLAFPFTRVALEAAGIPPHKITDCYPCIQYSRFYDPAPNGAAILNMGACLPKKRFEDYVKLAGLMTDRRFDLYPIGYASEDLLRYNANFGNRVTIHTAVEPEQMPPIYKSHGWLVYTGCPQLRTVGWPMAVAEAQAAGLGICMPRLRPDVVEYLGGAGFLYDSIEELPAILSQPYPEEMRARGFEQAKKSDIDQHKSKLTALWDACASRN